jgi:hypothetical protein
MHIPDRSMDSTPYQATGTSITLDRNLNDLDHLAAASSLQMEDLRDHPRSSITSHVVRARDVLAEPDLAVADGDLDEGLAVEHKAHERLALEDDPPVHGRRAPRRLLHQNADDAVAPLPALLFAFHRYHASNPMQVYICVCIPCIRVYIYICIYVCMTYCLK